VTLNQNVQSENLSINLKVMQKRVPTNEKSFDSKSFIYLKALYEYGTAIFVFIRKFKPIFHLVILTVTALPNQTGGRNFTEHLPIQSASQRRRVLSSQQLSVAPILNFSSSPRDSQELYFIIQMNI